MAKAPGPKTFSAGGLLTYVKRDPEWDTAMSSSNDFYCLSVEVNRGGCLTDVTVERLLKIGVSPSIL